ncbi:MAG: hypothetical protein MJ138_01660 [Kiritimatiellae bacterium]|nr:hypothetical protein [Kiritimatiellia bacterium]
MNGRWNATLALAVVAGLAAAGVREGELTTSTWTRDVEILQPMDLRVVFPVAKLENEPALRNLAYSAVGWDLDASVDATRTVTVTARAGTWSNGAFSPDGTPAVTVLAATTGRGAFDWRPVEISKKIYQLSHVVSKGGVVDGSATLYGYLDFSQAAVYLASQAEVEAAALAEITHEIAVGQDAQSPWQPVDSATARSGIATDEGLAPGTRTATTFTFKGCGVLRYEYRLTGGTLEVSVDGAVAETLSEAAAEWVPREIAFADHGTRVASFVHVAGAEGAVAIRNVRWEEQPESSRADGAGGVRVDLREGVRTPRLLRDVLPFAYSSTNWIGDVVGVSAASVAKVTVVELAGTDSDVRNWLEAGTPRVLVNRPGEGSVEWQPRKGVWKATFDVLDGGASIHRETAVFDLRASRGGGFAVLVK